MTAPEQTHDAAQAYDITPVRSKQDRAAFLELPYTAYRDDPAWRAPLRMMKHEQIAPAKNPGLARMQHELFLARQNGQVIGRIGAFVNPAHLDQHQDKTGQFGFLDTLHPDPDLVAALLGRAETWLTQKGMTRMTGPFNSSINEECGMLVDGFETPPMILMPHGRADYGPACERAGLRKAIDTYAFHFRFSQNYELPRRITRVREMVDAYPELRIRPMDMRKFKEELRMVLDMFNDAWSENWGFVPFSEDQITIMAKELRPLLNSKSLWMAEFKGEPIAFALFLPDVNELADGLDGKLWPLGWARLLYRLKVRGPVRSRLPLAGLRREYHKTKLGILAAIGSFESAIHAQFEQGVREIESSWVLETNTDLIAMCESYGMEICKTYRIYEKDL